MTRVDFDFEFAEVPEGVVAEEVMVDEMDDDVEAEDEVKEEDDDEDEDVREDEVTREDEVREEDVGGEEETRVLLVVSSTADEALEEGVLTLETVGVVREVVAGVYPFKCEFWKGNVS